MSDYIDKITDKDTGDSRIISPAAEDVRVDNENFEGSDLDEVLDEVAHAIDEAGSGDGTVTGVKVGSTTYEPTEGVVDLSTPIGNKVDKVTGYGLSKNDYTDTDKTKVDGLKPVATSGSYNDLTDKPTIPTVPTMDSAPTAGNTTHTVSSDGVATAIAAAIAQAGGQVTVTTNGDGTFTINVGNDSYTINLNHTHPNMAKIVKVTEATLPQELDDDTIYVQVDNATTPTEIEALYLFGLEFAGGGGVSPSAPRITSPANGSTIEVGSIASGDSSVSYQVAIKAKNLTQALTAAITSGSGYSLTYGQQSGASVSIPAADANNPLGATLTIVCTNTAMNAAGVLEIGDGVIETVECNLIANKPTYTDIAGVKLTGTQYLRLNYQTNPNTKLEIDMQFERNEFSDQQSVARDNNNWLGMYKNTNGKFNSNFSDLTNPSIILYWLGDRGYIEGQTAWKQDYESKLFDRSWWIYTNGTENGNVKFNGFSTVVEKKTTSQDGDLMVGGYVTTADVTSVFKRYNISIFALKISEDGELLMDLVPKLENGTTPGLYDTVNNVFYKSGTEYPFAAINS